LSEIIDQYKVAYRFTTAIYTVTRLKIYSVCIYFITDSMVTAVGKLACTNSTILQLVHVMYILIVLNVANLVAFISVFCDVLRVRVDRKE